MYIDTHAHLNYDDNRFGDENLLVQNIKNSGVEKVIVVGWDYLSSQKAKDFAYRHDGYYFAAGVHPSDISKATQADYDVVRALLKDKKAVALGEIGLDYHYENIDEKAQQNAFNLQMEIAHSEKLPFIIHSRDATEDTLKILKNNKNLLEYGAVMHCFSGSEETAKEYLKLNLYISFAGPVTFKNARRLDEVAKIVPSDKILVETDSPYLAPVPFRGTLNTPCNIPIIVEKLAFLRGESVEKVAQDIYKNAHTLFFKMEN